MNAYLLAALLFVQAGGEPREEASQAAQAKKADGEELVCKKKIVRGDGLLTNVRTRKVCKTRDEWDRAKSSGE